MATNGTAFCNVSPNLSCVDIFGCHSIRKFPIKLVNERSWQQTWANPLPRPKWNKSEICSSKIQNFSTHEPFWYKLCWLHETSGYHPCIYNHMGVLRNGVSTNFHINLSIRHTRRVAVG
ncbi:hypothetical protein ACJW31_05G194000 [Castanea mollissima]